MIIKETKETENTVQYLDDETHTVPEGSSLDNMPEVEEHSAEVYSSVNPKMFDGKGLENIQEFFKAFRIAARANRWTEEKKLLQLPCYLEVIALDFFETIEGQGQVFMMTEKKYAEAFTLASELNELILNY